MPAPANASSAAARGLALAEANSSNAHAHVQVNVSDAIATANEQLRGGGGGGGAAVAIRAVLLSIAAYECIECIVEQLGNAELMCPHAGRVLHLNEDMWLTPAEAAQLHRLPDRAARLGAFVNPDRVLVQSKGPGIMRAHWSNFRFAEAEPSLSSFTHFATIAADMLFLKPGYTEYIVDFDGTDHGHCANFRKQDMHPQAAVTDEHLLTQLQRIGRNTSSEVLHDRADRTGCLSYGMIDGMFWRRNIFATLREAAPFSPTDAFTSDAFYPFNLLTPLLNRTCKGLGIARASMLPPPTNTAHSGFGAIARWSTYGRAPTFADVKWCLLVPAPDCFVMKGFHGTEGFMKGFQLQALVHNVTSERVRHGDNVTGRAVDAFFQAAAAAAAAARSTVDVQTNRSQQVPSTSQGRSLVGVDNPLDVLSSEQ